MDLDLSAIEVRILGALIEKEITTPEYYPLTLNSLQAACNQKSNRDPVMQLDEKEIARTIDLLKDKRLVWQRSVVGSRVPKFEHNFRSFFKLSDAETAIVCVLLLRGPQTAGEIKGRTERLYQFKSLEDVDTAIQKLLTHDSGPFVMEVPRQAGQKEKRFMHLFSSEMMEMIKNNPETIVVENQAVSKPVVDRYGILENEIISLREELAQLRADFEDLKRQLQ